MLFEKTRYWLGAFFHHFRNRFNSLFVRTEESLGQKGESMAEAFLKKKKYRIVARNYRESFGEIDLIAVDARTVVFVEVKSRTDDRSPESAVDRIKQRKIIQTARSYLRRHGLTEERIRFDVVAISFDGSAKKSDIHHIQDAFHDESQPDA